MPTVGQNPSTANAALEQAGRKLQPSAEAQFGGRDNILYMILYGVLAAGLLQWVAFYNGYPTVFSDTGSYLLTGAFHVAFAPFRAPGYSVFTNLTSLRTSGWFTIATQAVLVGYVLHETFDHLIGGDRDFLDRCLLAGVCVLAALTSLPWLVSLLMPDVFAGILFLCAFLLASIDESRLVQRFFLASIMTVSVAAHASLFPIAALFVAALVVPRFVGRKTHEIPRAWSVLAWLLAPILAAGFWTATLNHTMGLGFKLSPSKNTFLLARLFGDGLAPDFLRENCTKRQFISCRYLSDLPHTEGELLFHHPLLLDLKGHDDEVEAIVRGTLLAFPRRFLMSSAWQTLRQLVALRTGDEIRSYTDKNWNNGALPQVFPGDVRAFRNSRQSRGGLLRLADAVAPVHTTIFWLSVAACPLLAWTGRCARINKFLIAAITFLVINAAVCGALAGVYDRYQSRVAWIMPLCLTAYICCLIKEWKRRPARREPIQP